MILLTNKKFRHLHSFRPFLFSLMIVLICFCEDFFQCILFTFVIGNYYSHAMVNGIFFRFFSLLFLLRKNSVNCGCVDFEPNAATKLTY